MKRFFLLATFVCAALFTSCEGYDDSALVNRLDNFETRLKKLEELCSQMNTNISSLQTIVNAIQKNDHISAIAPINKDGKEIGYTIVFTSGKSITIYHGSDGKDGQDGADGKDGADGHTPIIGVKQDTDGNYYWTIDGEWLTDDNGNKIKANGTDGKDGANGTDGNDGQNGENGENGTDGITPQLKIENDYWYVSYDNGATWKQLGKATGEDGTDGTNGKDGKDGDSFFQNVTQDNDNVYFILADGTTITIAKSKSIVLTYIPRYSDGKATVYYSTKEDSFVEFDFEVSPASAAADWSEFATVKAVYTETRAGVQMVDMAILSWTVDINAGTITVKASGANLSDAFFAGTQEASARLAIDDDNLNLLSDYIPMVAKSTTAQPDPEPTSQPDNEIWYTSSNGEAIIPNNTDDFGANIISITYENGKGVIKFDGAVTSIGYRAFSTCSNLIEFSIPDSVTSIGFSAFSECTNLQKFHGKFASEDGRCLIVDGILKAFAPAELTGYTIPNSVKRIGDSVFKDCSSLTEVTIPNSVTIIGQAAFYGCSSLTEITIPNSVKAIEYHVFNGCSSLTKVIIPNSIGGIGSYVFNGCSSLTEIIIPNSVKAIGNMAFGSCHSLTEFTIPSSVIQIEGYAFFNCSNLQNIICKPTTPPTGDNAMFASLGSSAKIYVPVGSGEAYKAAQYWSNYADIIEEKEM